MGSGRRLRIEAVRGEPYLVGARKLTPKARIVSYGRARGTVGHRRVSGWGYGFASVAPLAIIEETDQGERSVAIRDASSAALCVLLGSAVASTLLFTAVRWWARRAGRQGR